MMSAECLKELNEHVSGSFVEESPKSLLTRKPEFFKDFDIVIGTQFDETMCRDLDAVCRNYDVYLVIVRSYGLFGSLRVCEKYISCETLYSCEILTLMSRSIACRTAQMKYA